MIIALNEAGSDLVVHPVTRSRAVLDNSRSGLGIDADPIQAARSGVAVAIGRATVHGIVGRRVLDIHAILAVYVESAGFDGSASRCPGHVESTAKGRIAQCTPYYVSRRAFAIVEIVGI